MQLRKTVRMPTDNDFMKILDWFRYRVYRHGINEG